MLPTPPVVSLRRALHKTDDDGRRSVVRVMGGGAHRARIKLALTLSDYCWLLRTHARHPLWQWQCGRIHGSGGLGSNGTQSMPMFVFTVCAWTLAALISGPERWSQMVCVCVLFTPVAHVVLVVVVMVGGCPAICSALALPANLIAERNNALPGNILYW